MCFVWISEQTAIISLYNINWLVFITKTENVYCAVRDESLHTTYIQFTLQKVIMCKTVFCMGVTLGSPQDGKNIKGVWEWCAERNIWSYEGGINKMVEET